VLRKASAREGWGRTLKKGKKGRRSESSDKESDDEVIRVETGSDLDSEENKRRKGKKPAKMEVRTRKVRFENKGKKKKEGQEKVDELTRKLLQLNVRDNESAMAYAQLFVLVPEMTENLPLSSYFGASTIVVTSAAGAPTYPRYSQPLALMPRDFSYHFCKRTDCCLRTCPIAEEYVQLQ